MKVGDLVTVKFEDVEHDGAMLWVLLEIAPSSEVLVCSPQTGYKCWTRKRWVEVVE